MLKMAAASGGGHVGEREKMSPPPYPPLPGTPMETHKQWWQLGTFIEGTWGDRKVSCPSPSPPSAAVSPLTRAEPPGGAAAAPALPPAWEGAGTERVGGATRDPEHPTMGGEQPTCPCGAGGPAAVQAPPPNAAAPPPPPAPPIACGTQAFGRGREEEPGRLRCWEGVEPGVQGGGARHPGTHMAT